MFNYKVQLNMQSQLKSTDIKQTFDSSCSAFRQLPKSAIDVLPNLINLIYAAPRFYWMNVKPLRGFSEKTSSVFIQLVITLIFFRRRLRGIVSTMNNERDEAMIKIDEPLEQRVFWGSFTFLSASQARERKKVKGKSGLN